MHLQDIHNLYEYNYWANHRLLDVVETLSHEQFTKDLRSSHGGIHGTLVHIMAAEEIWLKRWKGESPTGLRKPEEFPTFEAMSDHWDMVEHEMMGFCHMLKSDDYITRMTTYKTIEGKSFSQPLYQMMQHLVNHSSYHRGQVSLMLRQLGAEPVPTDFLVFFDAGGQVD